MVVNRVVSANAYVAVLAIPLLAGCSADWKKATSANTVAAYKEYLANHPQDGHSNEARAAIDELDWSAAKAQNSIAGYNSYLTGHAQGAHLADAKATLDGLELAAWNSAVSNGKPAAYVDFHKDFPDSKRLTVLRANVDSSYSMTISFGGITRFWIGDWWSNKDRRCWPPRTLRRV